MSVRSEARPRAGGSDVAGRVGRFPRLTALWRQRRVLALLVSRDLKVKHADSYLGYVWTVLDPLLMAGVYWLLFTQLMDRQVGEDPYIVFLLCGLLPWLWANGAVRGSMRAFNKDAKLVRSTNLPREIWVLRMVLSRLMDFVLAIPVLAFFAVLNGAQPSWQLVFVPVAMVLQGVMLTGLALLLAPIVILFSDIERLVRLAMRLLFFLSPVVYGLEDVQRRLGDTAANFYAVNPFAGIIDVYRLSFFPDQWPGWLPIATSTVTAFLLLLAGARVFRRLEPMVLKEI